MSVLYDKIGLDYAALRRPDPRIAQQIAGALGPGRDVLNVGAGAGSYEPTDRPVTAIEPSATMIAQRPPSDAVVMQGTAEDLPFTDNSFDAAMAVLTIHHWTDKARGVAQMRRVARGRVVFLTYDPAFRGFWLTDYFPALTTLDEGIMPAMAEWDAWLPGARIEPVPVPHDCTDGFLAAYWRRPAVYLDARARAAMSPFGMIGDVSAGLARLEDDLHSGEWARRYGDLLGRGALDCGYRLVIAPS